MNHGRLHTYIYSLALGIVPEVHFIDAPKDVRKKRVDKRKAEKDPDVYVFDVTDAMFNFMEPMFEQPDNVEFEHGIRVDAG